MANVSQAINFLGGGFAVTCLVLASGCSGVAPSKTVSTAGTGAVAGAVAGGVIGNNTGSGNQVSGAAVGGLAGAAVGAVVGAIGEAKERNEQDRLAQERAYQQELAKKRAAEAKFAQSIQDELAVAEGFRITDEELAKIESTARDREMRLKQLQEERQAALNKKRQLDTAEGRIQSAEQEIERLEAELAELRGQSAADTASASLPMADKIVMHEVRRGENITSIAQLYKVPVSKIRAANENVDVDNLIPGQKLRIPVTSVSVSAGA